MCVNTAGTLGSCEQIKGGKSAPLYSELSHNSPQSTTIKIHEKNASFCKKSLPLPLPKACSRLEWTEEQQSPGKHQSFELSSFFQTNPFHRIKFAFYPKIHKYITAAREIKSRTFHSVHLTDWHQDRPHSIQHRQMRSEDFIVKSLQRFWLVSVACLAPLQTLSVRNIGPAEFEAIGRSKVYLHVWFYKFGRQLSEVLCWLNTALIW